MDYNELKLEILQLLSKTGPLDSTSLAKVIAESHSIVPDIHALRMALMRYHRLGLLKRQRVEGVYKYGITERGLRRLSWLLGQKATVNQAEG